jgi:citrate lyase subunit beta/citryl-CoA lyase
MGCIHPAQVKVINDVFIPNEHEIEYALKVAKAFNEAQKEGKNVVALGSKMVDPPVVKRAMRIISEATKAGLIPDREEGL